MMSMGETGRARSSLAKADHSDGHHLRGRHAARRPAIPLHHLCSIETVPYSQFEQLLAQEKIAEVSVGPDKIQGKLKEQLPSGNSAFVTARVDMALADKLAQKGVSVRGVPASGALQSLLSWIFPIVVLMMRDGSGPSLSREAVVRRACRLAASAAGNRERHAE
ncbi:hypothetical protein XI09_17925 [Bradyrhizobium sp. CCBAU 11386]|uniref:ATP-dependent metallopeptidase FtsH/Yme1/Tma family protein n=1 Tax=Bradyrhizobium sp. CCBAU 11386 TaxID=1630837 RepID=UPI0023029AD4|nr:ATP-dependent metallopeptidase FtsH/Yme1/Tma family protein [Bradyrhizobium sp. CCBAU 11386]MDA9506475.1 hypothetical protein [Bradyrhizobium sp. CCBAU 11386]